MKMLHTAVTNHTLSKSAQISIWTVRMILPFLRAIKINGLHIVVISVTTSLYIGKILNNTNNPNMKVLNTPATSVTTKLHIRAI